MARTLVKTIGMVDWIDKDSNFSASINRKYSVDTSSNTVNVTLPASPKTGEWVEIIDAAGDFDTNSVTLLRNGNKINNLSDDLELDVADKRYIIVYEDAPYGWRIL